MKIRNILLLFMCVVSFVGCNGVYEPGDYYRGEGYDAVVVTVDAGNQPTMVMSLDEANTLDADSALRWAEKLGEGWRLPNKTEISQIERVKTLINNTLKKKDKPAVLVDFTYYWSSTPCSESHFYACGPDGVGCYYSENDGSTYRARAVRTVNK